MQLKTSQNIWPTKIICLRTLKLELRILQRVQRGTIRFANFGKSTELTANGFADEVAQFYGLKRLTLPQLVAAPSLTGRFSPRFLRDTAVFPFEMPKGHYKLAVADPSDAAAVRAAEIVLGAPVLVEIASFEDIATVLGEQLGGEETAAGDG